ncbi:MAG: methyltransferase domain-containing protein [Acidobacteria bacterium]|nr:methyltransferase domain-containing protein [Acidobacteriota bacterium]
MPEARDLWSEWLLNRRFGGNIDQLTATLEHLRPIRDKVLLNAKLGQDQTLLDVGCGDGLIGFAALDAQETTNVIFSDVSQDLLNHTEDLARELGAWSRCKFVRASAEALAGIGDESVQAVTTRSVLIYVPAKQQAFREFYRVLKPGGRLSIFEPLNRFAYPEPPNLFAGFDVRAVAEIARKVKAVAERAQPPDRDPMFDFDERTLLEFAVAAGFEDLHLELQIEVKPNDLKIDWDTWSRIAPNPKMPTLEEAMQEALAPAERETFTTHLRPLFEARKGIVKSAVAYLWAVR